MTNLQNVYTTSATQTIAIIPLTSKELKDWLGTQDKQVANWVKSSCFTAKSGTICFMPKGNGKLAAVLLGIKDLNDFWAFGALPQELPTGNYFIKAADWKHEQLEKAAIAWGLGAYQFAAYKKHKNLAAKLKLTPAMNPEYVKSMVTATFLVRDLINTPAEHLTPQKLGIAVAKIGSQFHAKVKQTFGAKLKRDYPAVYAIGKSSHNLPRLIELRWGKAKDPKITLVGKGVCFDSGGLNLKPPASMMHMKKDMAGAATALGVAKMIMEANLPVNLHLIIPAVENVVSSHSYKMGDIVQTRKKMTVEITNTDAEGRMILADALTLASESKPKLIIDFATLTGAATVALGAEIPALFSNNEKIAHKILEVATKEKEPMWRMPLYPPYREMLDSKVADIKNSASGSHGGAITAALFLKEFVAPNIPWIHLDIESMNYKTKPGRPEGGEALSLRTVFRFIKEILNSKF